MSGRTRRGRPPYPDRLTPAEWRVVNGVRHGMTNRQLASRLRISLDGVKFHVANAVAKLGLSGRMELRHWRGAPAGGVLVRRERAVSDTLRLGPIGQVSREVSDVERAVAWYRDVLGLAHLYTFGDLAFFDCGGTRLFLSHHEEGNNTGNSVLYFRVDDIDAAYEELSGRGVAFRGAPHLIHRHADTGVAEWMAFFEDLDGGLLALMSQVAPK